MQKPLHHRVKQPMARVDSFFRLTESSECFVEAEVEMADKPKYFWDVWLDKRRAKQSRRAESAIPPAPMSKEDRMRMIGCVAILVGIVILIVVVQIIGSHQPPPAPPKG
jgi:hypothetical protein